MSATRMALVCGGTGAEHAISLISASNIVNALDARHIQATIIGIDRAGVWHRYPSHDFANYPDDPARIALKKSNNTLTLCPGRGAEALRDAVDCRALAGVDVVFPIVHGTMGEDGSLQGLCRHLDLAFVGCDVAASAAAMDKDMAKRLLRDAGLPVAAFRTFNAVTAPGAEFDTLRAELGDCLFVKPASQGSSVGVTRVKDRQSLPGALDEALRFDSKVVVEAAIDGREIECAILGDADSGQPPAASECGEIVLGDGFYSFESKYLDADAAGIAAPADLPAATRDAIRSTALAAFAALGCSGMARVDCFLTADDKIVVNEINTLPGFTPISMYPKLWQQSGIEYSELIERLVALARDRRDRETRRAG